VCLKAAAADAMHPKEESKGHDASYFIDWPSWRPKLISPLSMRMLKPQVGLLQTQALYVIGAPSRP
jgi:hypothetical protein